MVAFLDLTQKKRVCWVNQTLNEAEFPNRLTGRVSIDAPFSHPHRDSPCQLIVNARITHPFSLALVILGLLRA